MKAAKGDKGACDRLFSKIVRARDRFCQHCGTTDALQCAHIVSRKYNATRCDEANAMALCVKCHMYFTAWPDAWHHWLVTSYMTEEAWQAVYVKAQAGIKTTRTYWPDLRATLTARLAELEGESNATEEDDRGDARVRRPL